MLIFLCFLLLQTRIFIFSRLYFVSDFPVIFFFTFSFITDSRFIFISTLFYFMLSPHLLISSSSRSYFVILDSLIFIPSFSVVMFFNVFFFSIPLSLAPPLLAYLVFFYIVFFDLLFCLMFPCVVISLLYIHPLLRVLSLSYSTFYPWGLIIILSVHIISQYLSTYLSLYLLFSACFLYFVFFNFLHIIISTFILTI